MIKITIEKEGDLKKALMVVLALSVTEGLISPETASQFIADNPEPAAEATQKTPDDEPKKDPTPVEEAQPKQEPTTEAPTSAPTLEELRTALAPIARDHRPVLVEKLRELGAKNLTNLSEDKYVEMLEFMLTLS